MVWHWLFFFFDVSFKTFRLVLERSSALSLSFVLFCLLFPPDLQAKSRPRPFYFHLLRCILFLSTLRKQEKLARFEVPEVRTLQLCPGQFIAPSFPCTLYRKHGQVRCSLHHYMHLSWSARILDSWYKVDEDISTDTGQGTVKDDRDFRRRGFNNRDEEYEDFFTVMKINNRQFIQKGNVNDAASLLL